jgi:hypothetical protein
LFNQIALWVQAEDLSGDFFAQNTDVVQPGPIAPWYHRFGHTVNAIDSNGDGEEDLMILAGGFNPSPDNDIWISENGTNWM